MIVRHAAPAVLSFVLRLLALIALGLFAACAPSPAMIATLTMLPGTPTPRPPTPYPSRTPRQPTGTATIAPEKCPSFPYDTGVPDDASLMVGRHYDLKHLPEAFEGPESGPLSDPLYRWVRVRWQGRSLYWIDHQICQDTARRPFYEVIDALSLPRLDPARGEIETRSCLSDNQPLENVIAFGMLDTDQPEAKTLNVQAAWIIESVSGAPPAFSVLNTGELECKAE